LARKSSGDNINGTLPLFAIKRSYIIPYRESFEHPIALALKEHPSTYGINFNSASGAPSKELASQDAETCPCK
jgi:hypothetical protein